MYSELTYKIAFGSLKGMNFQLASELLSRVGSEQNFFSASHDSLKSILGFDSKLLDNDYRREILEKAVEETAFVDDNKINIIYFTDDDYPQRLKECDDAPALMYSLGNCDVNSNHVISIVGTRHATPYGIHFISELVEEISRRLPNTIIVSGLAYGVDITAHKEALNHKLSTVAVLAHGLSTIYPAPHRSVAVEMIRKNGMLLTEYSHVAKMNRGNFIARNRIVAGLSECTVVVESGIKGGAMITANIANSYNRDVFALPGRNSDLYSQGCNHLITENMATLIQNLDDLVMAMRWETKPIEKEQPKLVINLSEEEQKVVDFLKDTGEGNINRISVETGLKIHRLVSLLVDMEFKGLLLAYPGGLYRLA